MHTTDSRSARVPRPHVLRPLCRPARECVAARHTVVGTVVDTAAMLFALLSLAGAKIKEIQKTMGEVKIDFPNQDADAKDANLITVRGERAVVNQVTCDRAEKPWLYHAAGMMLITLSN